MLKLKLQYFDHLMLRTDSLENTMMLGNIEGVRRRKQQRMRWLDGITDLMDMSLSNSRSWWWTGKHGMQHGMLLIHGIIKSCTWLCDWIELNWTQNNLWIQWNLYQTTNMFFTKLEQILSQFVWKHKKPNSQSNLEKEEWNWRNQTFWLQTILQSYSHPDSMVLAQRHKYRSMVYNRKSRDKSTHLWTPYLWERRQKYTIEERQFLQQMVLGNLVNHV